MVESQQYPAEQGRYNRVSLHLFSHLQPEEKRASTVAPRPVEQAAADEEGGTKLRADLKNVQLPLAEAVAAL